jgi:hypothetical protein
VFYNTSILPVLLELPVLCIDQRFWYSSIVNSRYWYIQYCIYTILDFRYCNITILVFLVLYSVRDRPFNLKGGGYGFLLRSEFVFRTTQEFEYLFFLSREFFFQNLTLHYMTKTQNIFLKKNHNPPPLQVKWSFPYITVQRTRLSL